MIAFIDSLDMPLPLGIDFAVSSAGQFIATFVTNEARHGRDGYRRVAPRISPAFASIHCKSVARCFATPAPSLVKR